MHPGIVLDGPNAYGYYRVAMISNNVLGDGPRAPIELYAPGMGMGGDVDLALIRYIHGSKMRTWKRKVLGPAPPISQSKLEELKVDINWAIGEAIFRKRR